MADKDFEAEFHRITMQVTPEALRRGLTMAGLQIMDDAVNEVKQVPLDEGTLHSSGSVFVNAKLVGHSNEDGKGTPALNFEAPAGDGTTLVATVGFNTPYAARMHEGVDFEFQRAPAKGAKYLESKLSANRDEYMQIVVGECRRSLQQRLVNVLQGRAQAGKEQ